MEKCDGESAELTPVHEVTAGKTEVTLVHAHLSSVGSENSSHVIYVGHLSVTVRIHSQFI